MVANQEVAVHKVVAIVVGVGKVADPTVHLVVKVVMAVVAIALAVMDTVVGPIACFVAKVVMAVHNGRALVVASSDLTVVVAYLPLKISLHDVNSS